MRSLWRVSNHCDLIGLGGEKADGRWHTMARGKRIVYLSEHPALALVENLVNLKGNPALFPEKYQLMQVEVSDDVSVTTIMEDSDPLIPFDRTQALGDEWLRLQNSALATVPSFPSPFSTNYLLNPFHPDASRVRILKCVWIAYDHRLFRTLVK